MFGIGKYLALLFLGQHLSEKPMIGRLITGMAAVVVLTIVAGVLVGALVLAGLYGGYSIMLANGMEEAAALITMCVIAALLVSIMVLTAYHYVHRLVNIPHAAEPANPILPILDAFVDGLLTHPKDSTAAQHEPTAVRSAEAPLRPPTMH